MNIVQLRQQYPQLNQYTDKEILDDYARQLGMDEKHPRYQELASQFLARDRTWGEALGDTALGIGQGLSAVGEFGGMVLGAMTPGAQAFGNPITEAMSNASEYLGEQMSPGMQNRQANAARNTEIARQRAAERGESELGAGLRAQASNYWNNPGMALHDTISTAPTMLAGGPVGRVAMGLARTAGPKIATRIGIGSAVGTSGAMQGYEAGGEVYEELIKQGLSHEEATAEAARAMGTSAAVSAGLSMVPGGQTIERSMLGSAARTGVQGRLRQAGRGVVGEGITEGIDEGFAAHEANVRIMPHDETRTRWQGVGEAVVQGGVAGAGLGGATGFVARPPQATTETGEKDLLKSDDPANRPLLEEAVPDQETLALEGPQGAPQLGFDPNVPGTDGPSLPGRVVFEGDQAFYEEGYRDSEEGDWIQYPIAPEDVESYLRATGAGPGGPTGPAAPPPPAPEDPATFVDIAGPEHERTPRNYADLYAEPLELSPYDQPAEGGLRTGQPTAPATTDITVPETAEQYNAYQNEALDLEMENVRDRDDVNQGVLDPAVAQPRMQARAERVQAIRDAIQRSPLNQDTAPEADPEDAPYDYSRVQWVGEAPPATEAAPEAVPEPAPQAGQPINAGRLLETLRAAEQETGTSRSAILQSGERVRANAPTIVRSIINDRDPLGVMEVAFHSGELTQAQEDLVSAWYTEITGNNIEDTPTGETGFVAEPDPQVRAQLDALREGRRPVVIMGTQQAARLRGAMGGLSQAEVRDPETGERVVVVSDDPQKIKAASDRAREVGMRQAMGEAMGVVDPTQTDTPAPDAVVVQQIDNETGQSLADEVVPESRVGEVTPVPGTTPRVTTPDVVAQERRQGTLDLDATEAPPAVEPTPAQATPAPDPVQATDEPVVDDTPEPAPAVDPDQALFEAEDAALPKIDGRSSAANIINVLENARGEELFERAQYLLYKKWGDDAEPAVEAYFAQPENALSPETIAEYNARYDAELAESNAKKNNKKKNKQGQVVPPAPMPVIDDVAHETSPPPPADVAPAADPAPSVVEAAPTPDWVLPHANSVGGEVVHVGDGIALVAGHSMATGRLVYVGVHQTHGRTKVDMRQFEGEAFTRAEVRELRQAIRNHEAAERTKQNATPDGPFLGGSNMAVSESVDPRLGLLLDRLMKAVNLDGVRVFLFHPADVRGNRDAYNLHGDFASASSAGMDANENGSTRRFGSRKGDHYIALDPNLSPERAVETVAHELGHIIEKTALENATPATKKAIKKAYEKWLEDTKTMTAPEIIRALRNVATAEAHAEGVGDNAKLSPYWTSFSEWFADNVSKWVTTARKPSTLVDRFFQKVGDRIRQLAAALGGKRYAPNPEVASFLDAMAEQGNPELSSIMNEPTDPGSTDPVDRSRAPNIMDNPMMRPSGTPAPPRAPRAPGPAAASTPTPEAPLPVRGVEAALKYVGRRVLPGRHNVTKALLHGLSVRQIRDQYGHILPAVRGWAEAILERSGTASNIANEANSVDKVWASLSRADSDALSEVLLGATVAEIYLDNNTKEYLDSLTPEQLAEHKRLNNIKLTDTAKKVRRDALAVLNRQWEYTHQSLTKLLNHTIRDADVRQAEITKLDAIFGKRRGDYFPLSRFGNQVVIGKNAAEDGGDVVTFHENTASAEAERERLQREGIESVIVTELTKHDSRERASTGFVADLHSIVENSGIEDSGTREGMHQAIQQLYMKSLPEISGAKRMIRRGNVEGYSRNARRGFADAVTKGSRYAAQLDFAPRIHAAQEAAENQTRATDRQSVSVVIGRKAGSPAKVRIVPAGTERYKAAEALMNDGYTVSHQNTTPSGAREFIAGTLRGATPEQLDRFKARAQDLSQAKTGVQDLRQAKVVYNHMKDMQAKAAAMNPSQVSELIGQAGYVWFLGVTPAFLFMNMMQNPMIGLPVLGAKFGVAKTSLEWGRQARWFSGVRIGKLLAEGKEPFSVAWLRRQVESGTVTGLNKDQLDMLQRLEDMQLIDFTQPRDLANVGSASSEVWQKGLHIASAGAHHVEVFNRVTAALTSYNLALRSDPNMTHKEATRHAEDDVTKIHFDYSPANKPQVMRGNVMRPLMMFQQYRQHLLYWWANNTKEMVQGETPEVRRAAMKGAFLMGATNALFAGALGLPFVGTIQFLAELFLGEGDDGEEFDFEKWVTEAANDAEAATGVSGLSAVMTKGIFAAMGMNIGQRISQADLMPFLNLGSARFERDAGDKARAYLFDLAGPVGSVAVDMVRSTDAFARGDVVAGLAQMTPKAIADGLRAWQMGTEGIKNRKGDILAHAEAFDGYDIFLQATGVMPSTAADIRADRGRIFEMDQEFQRRTSKLTGNFIEAWQRQDRQGMVEATQHIQAYNQRVVAGKFGKNPELMRRLVLDGRRIEQAIRQRQQRAYMRALSGGRADTQRQMLLGMQMSGLIQQISPQSIMDNASHYIDTGTQFLD